MMSLGALHEILLWGDRSQNFPTKAGLLRLLGPSVVQCWELDGFLAPQPDSSSDSPAQPKKSPPRQWAWPLFQPKSLSRRSLPSSRLCGALAATTLGFPVNVPIDETGGFAFWYKPRLLPEVESRLRGRGRIPGRTITVRADGGCDQRIQDPEPRQVSEIPC